MTTLTPGGQRLAEALFERGLLYRTEIGAYLAHPMGRDVRPDLNAAATTLALDAPPAGGDGGLREAFEDAALARDEAGFAGTPAQCIRYLDAEVTRLAALARPDPREQAAAGVGDNPHLREVIARAVEDGFNSGVRYGGDGTLKLGADHSAALGKAIEQAVAFAFSTGSVLASLAQQPAPQVPVADAAGVDWEREAARLRAELTRIHDFSASSMLIRNDALDMIRSVARQALKSAALTPPQAARPALERDRHRSKSRLPQPFRRIAGLRPPW